MSNYLPPHDSQHARPPCPSPTPGVHSDSRLWSQWCHPTISSSVIPFSSCPQSLPASSFPMSQLFATPWIAAHQSSLSFTISWSLLKLMSTESVMLSTHLILCCPFSPLAFNLFFQWVVSSHYVAKVFGALASASVLPMNIQKWFLLGLTGLISLLSRGLSRVGPSSVTHSQLQW